jgi:multiple sugar transport system substrate-binding protein
MRMKLSPHRLAPVFLAAAATVASAAPASAQTRYDGTTVNIVTFTGPQIAEPLQRRAPDFKKLTGATINVITVPFSDLYNKLLTDVATGTNSYDATVFAPQWMVDFITAGYLEDLTPRIKADAKLKWDDIARSSAISAPLTRGASTPCRSMATFRWSTTARTS